MATATTTIKLYRKEEEKEVRKKNWRSKYETNGYINAIIIHFVWETSTFLNLSILDIYTYNT